MDELLQMLVNIGVHSAIRRSRSTEVTWKDYYSYGAYCDRIPLCEFIRRSPVAAEVADKYYAPTLEKVFDFADAEVIDIKQFWYLSCWFPQFFRTHDQFMEMNHVVFAEWFVMDDAVAVKRLAKGVKKSFVVRPSTSYPLTYPFTIMYNKETASGLSVEKVRVKRGTRSDTRTVGWKCELVPRLFDNLTDLVDALIKDGFIVAPLDTGFAYGSKH